MPASRPTRYRVVVLTRLPRRVFPNGITTPEWVVGTDELPLSEVAFILGRHRQQFRRSLATSLLA